MFGKKKEAKVKEPSQRDLLIDRIVREVEQLTPGQSLIYKLPEFFWSGFAAFIIAEPNPIYPTKGKKYCIYTDNMGDGKPAGKKQYALQSDKPKDVAAFIVERDGSHGSIERYQ